MNLVILGALRPSDDVIYDVNGNRHQNLAEPVKRRRVTARGILNFGIERAARKPRQAGAARNPVAMLAG